MITSEEVNKCNIFIEIVEMLEMRNAANAMTDWMSPLLLD